MSASRPRRYRPSAWLIGCVVLAALGASLAWMFRSPLRTHWDSSQLAARVGAGRESASVQGVPALPIQQGGAAPATDGLVRGVVRDPEGRPVASATVSLYRVLTAWPEWRSELLEPATTSDDGEFQFRRQDRIGLLVGVEHRSGFERRSFAGDLVEVPQLDVPLELVLRPGFGLFGFVVNDAGAPVPNARVALEAVPGEQRRAQVTTTSGQGRYEFSNIAAGPARLTASHPSWQPAVVPAVVVGDRVRVDLRFERPTMAALRGRVVSASSQAPIAGASVQLLPLNQKLGLAEPLGGPTAADGTFLVEGLPRGSMRLLVRHPDHGAVLRTQPIGAVATELLVELPPRSMVEGRLTAEGGVTVGGEVLELQDEAGQLAFTTVATDGRFRFPFALSPGSGELRAIGGRFAFQRSSGAAVSVRIRELATTELELTVVPAATVRGRFVDERGAPVVGVQVALARQLSESARVIGDAAFDLDLGAVGNRMLQLFSAERSGLLAVSDADGRFEIVGLQPGPALVRTARTGLGSRWLQLQVPAPGAPLDRGDIVLPRGSRIEGRVLRGNRPFVGATVTAVGESGSGSALTGRYGTFVIEDLVPDTYRLRARIPGQPTSSNEQVVTVAADRPAGNVGLALEVGREVRGHVTSNDGQPLGGALVSVRGVPGQASVTDGNGDFVLELPRRDIELQVSLGDRSGQRIELVTAEQETVDVRLDTPPTCTLVGHVAGLPGKKRLFGALLRLTPIDGDVAQETRTRWIELPDGNLRWPLCPSGRVRVEVWCDGYAPHADERVLAPNEDHDLGEVLLEPGSRLTGVVRDAAGAPVADAHVLLGEETDLDLFEPRVRSGPDGRFVVGGVSSRSSRLVVRARGFAAATVDLSLPRDVLSLEPLAVTLERGATIEVTVPRATAPDGGLVQLRRRGRLLASAELDDLGRASFTNRSAGTYTVQLFGHDLPPHEVRVDPEASVVRVMLELPAK